uniref:Uncharacterized protein n=1 Tax=Arundo donax TaxID=35708 RepID=A0A0A9CHK4_ARUDO
MAATPTSHTHGRTGTSILTTHRRQVYKVRPN